MSNQLSKDAHAVLFPAFDTLSLSHSILRFLDEGGCSILLGESRAEYVAREMSQKRVDDETAESFQSVTAKARGLADNLLVALDQEIAGICRLHELAPSFPTKENLETYSAKDFEELSREMARAAKDLGVNCFLAPILDMITGQNPWLKNRTWSTNPELVAKLSSAFIRGVQAEGVAATAKHFPGFHNIALDPAVEENAVVDEASTTFEAGFIPFRDAIVNGVEMVMVGPSIVEAFDAETPASISPNVIGMLKHEFGFKGVIMSDDLDAKATLRGSTVEEVAVKALQAGSDFLLLADIEDQVGRVASALSEAVKDGRLAEERLAEAAAKVRTLAAKYSP